MAIWGNPGPDIWNKSLDVRAMVTRLHWSTSPNLCLQFKHISLNVFHNDGEGKHLTQDTNQISYKTPKTRSHNWSPTSSVKTVQYWNIFIKNSWYNLPLTVGGDSKASLLAKRKPKIDSQVSRSKICDWRAMSWTRRSTRWQSTACLWIESWAERKTYNFIIKSLNKKDLSLNQAK